MRWNEQRYGRSTPAVIHMLTINQIHYGDIICNKANENQRAERRSILTKTKPVSSKVSVPSGVLPLVVLQEIIFMGIYFSIAKEYNCIEEEKNCGLTFANINVVDFGRVHKALTDILRQCRFVNGNRRTFAV